MTRIFDLDNPVWRFMGKVFDMMVLTVLWFVMSLPVITIGASTTALYYVSLKMASDQEGYVVKDFFRSFKQNFKQATAVWLIMLALGMFLAGDLWWYYQFKEGIGVMVFFMFLLMTVFYCMVLLYLFPLLARCEVTVKRLFLMAFVMSVKNFGWTLLMATIVVCLAALALFVCGPLLILAVGGIGYIHGKILNMVFRQYHLMIPGAKGYV